jgi:hypothetical protein
MALQGHWCDIIILNVHAPTEDKDDDIKDSFYEEQEICSLGTIRKFF